MHRKASKREQMQEDSTATFRHYLFYANNNPKYVNKLCMPPLSTLEIKLLLEIK